MRSKKEASPLSRAELVKALARSGALAKQPRTGSPISTAEMLRAIGRARQSHVGPGGKTQFVRTK